MLVTGTKSLKGHGKHAQISASFSDILQSYSVLTSLQLIP